MSNWFENHQLQKTKISTVIYAPFIQNSNQMASRLTATTSFPRVFFKATCKLFSSQGCLMTKTDFKIFKFRSSIQLSLQAFIPRGATLESCLTVRWFSSTNHNSLLRTVTNEIASFCVYNRLRQMAVFRVYQSGQRRGNGRLSCYTEIFWNKKKGFRYYIKRIDFMLPCVCSVIDHRRR